MQHIFLTTIRVLRQPRFALLFIAVALVFFTLFIAIPVVTIPGNSFEFQLSIFRTQDYVLMTLLAILVGLHVAFLAFDWRLRREARQIQRVTQGAVTGTLGVFGAIVGTAACSSCLAALFSIVGLGTSSVFFVLKNQPYFLLGTIALMLVSLYFTARKVRRICDSC